MSEGKARNGAATRDAILAAARRCFAAESYEAVGMRDVAREAGIDAALINRYFGSKEDLFRKVLLERTGGQWFGGHADREALAAWLTNLAVGDKNGPDDIERLLIILRSSASAVTAKIIRDAFVHDVSVPLAQLLGGDEEAETRASLALSLVIGATVLRSIVTPPQGNEDQREMERDGLLHLICEALNHSRRAAIQAPLSPRPQGAPPML